MGLTEKLFPRQANNDYQGYAIAQYGFYVLIAIYTFRSFVHFLAEDGAVNSIASLFSKTALPKSKKLQWQSPRPDKTPGGSI